MLLSVNVTGEAVVPGENTSVLVDTRENFEDNNPTIPEGQIIVIKESVELDGEPKINISTKIGEGVAFEDTDYIANMRAGVGYGSVMQVDAINEKDAKNGKISERTGHTVANVASGENAVAFGKYNVASGKTAFVFGYDSEASGHRAIATGANTIASGAHSFTAGGNTEAREHSSIAMGWGTIANNRSSIAMGWNTITNGTCAVALGYGNEAKGEYSAALNVNNIAAGDFQTVIGLNNEPYMKDSNGNYILENGNKKPLEAYFIIGNGINSNNRSNIFTVNKNKSITLGNTTITESELIFTKGIGTQISNRKIDLGQRNTITSDKAYNYFSIGWDNIITGRGSFSTGYMNEDAGEVNFTFGTGNKLKSSHRNAAVFGRYNNPDDDFLFAVGDGADDSNRSNALTVHTNGTTTTKNLIATDKIQIGNITLTANELQQLKDFIL